MKKVKKMKQALHLHEQRKCTFQELGALLGVRELLKRGLVRHSSDPTCPLNGDHTVNMLVASQKQDCGSVGCIGGSMAMIMGLDEDAAKAYVGSNCHIGTASQSFQSLFFPPNEFPGTERCSPERCKLANGHHWWTAIDAGMMIEAIDNWLASGKAHWPKIVRAHKLGKLISF